MAKITSENIDPVLKLIEDGFDYITNQNLEAANTPKPMTVEEIGEALGIKIDPRHKHDSKTFLSIFNALKDRPIETADDRLLVASSIYLTDEHFPGLRKKNK